MKKKPFSMHVDLDAFIPATDKEKEYMVQMRPSSTFFKDGVKRLLKNKIATISFFIIIILSLTSIFLPLFWPYGYDQMLGMDSIGRMDASYGNISPFRYGDTELERILGTAKVHQVFVSTSKAYLEDVAFEEVKESEGLTSATAALEAAKGSNIEIGAETVLPATVDRLNKSFCSLFDIRSLLYIPFFSLSNPNKKSLLYLNSL